MVYQGPTRPGTNVAVFRATGESVSGSGGSYQGPTRPGRDEELFRQTGQSVISGSAQANTLRQSLVQQQQAASQAAKTLASQQASAERQQALIEQHQREIIVNASGGVKIGDRSYIGNAVVPDTGMTANQYRKYLQQQALKEGTVAKKDIGRVGWRVTPAKEETKQDINIPTNVSNLFGSNKETIQKSTVAEKPMYLSNLLPTINLDNFNFGSTDFPKTETIQTTTKVTKGAEVHTPGTIYQTQTGGTTGKLVETKYVGEDYSSRVATASERKQLEEDLAAKSYKEVALSETPSTISRLYGEKKGVFSNLLSEEVVDKQWLQDISQSEYLTPAGKKVVSFTGGTLYGAVGTKGAILQTGVVYGATAGAGFAIKGATSGATYGATRLLGTTAGRVTGATLKTGVTAGGLYLGGTYAVGQATRIYYAPTAFEKGSITGRTATDLTVGLYGFKAGSKGWDITEGLIRTRGMKDITKLSIDPLVESGQHKFVEISKSKYQKLSQSQRQELYKNIFESNKELQEALGVKKGGIHITDQPGTYKDLTRAIHIAPKASTGFGGLDGKGSSTKYIPSIKELFSAPKKPGAVWFESTEGFGKVKGFEYKRGFYKWETRLLSGKKSYIPGTKPEIEAVFDISVTKGFEPVKYNPSYIKTHGVRVPYTGAYKPIEISQADIFAKNLKIVQENYLKLQRYGENVKLTKGHGGEHLYSVQKNVYKLVDLYPEFHPELIKTYGSISQAKIQLGKGALLHDLGKLPGRGGGAFHGERVADVLSSGKLGTKVNPKIIEAIYYHEKTFGAYTPEGKILATADRLDLTRFRNKVVNPELLPLKDALSRIDGGNIKKIIEPKDIPNILSETSSPYQSPALFNPSAGVTSYSLPPVSQAPITYSVTSSPTSYSSAMSSLIPSSSVSSVISSSKVYPSKRPSGVSKSYAPTSLSKVTPSASSLVSTSKSPPKTLPSYPSSSPQKSPSYYPPIIKKSLPFKIQGQKLPKTKFKKINIYGRRFGKWRSIGFGRTSKEAITKGQSWAERTLGVSFKIGGKVKPQKLKGFRTKKSKKEGLIYIEKIGRRLKRKSGEIPEIQYYQKMKGGKK